MSRYSEESLSIGTARSAVAAGLVVHLEHADRRRTTAGDERYGEDQTSHGSPSSTASGDVPVVARIVLAVDMKRRRRPHRRLVASLIGSLASGSRHDVAIVRGSRPVGTRSRLIGWGFVDGGVALPRS
jgi:hypothetical protein